MMFYNDWCCYYIQGSKEDEKNINKILFIYANHIFLTGLCYGIFDSSTK